MDYEKASDGIQLCLERHLSTRRERAERKGDERRRRRRGETQERERERGRRLLCLMSQSIISATPECIMQMGHNYCLGRLCARMYA